MNATIHEVNNNFLALISERGVYKRICNSNSPDKLKRMYNLVNSIRERIKNGKPVTLDLKIKWLLLSGWRPGRQEIYTKKQVVEILDKAAKLNKQVRSMGGAFLLEHIQKMK